MSNRAEDERWLRHCFHLAHQGWYSTQPNPRVGAVIVSNGQLLGEGAHLQAGDPHAEVLALRMAGQAAKGATAYVSLEPCSHHGRTPPCSLALIDAGVTRVVIGMQDPNPLVSGQGIQLLRDAGITVDGPLLAADAETLNLGFCKRMRTGLPWVRLKMAASMDGRTAMADGESQWLTGEAARLDVQYGRAQSGAVLSTATTVIADQAALNLRPEQLEPLASGLGYRQPLRVILDARLRVPLSARLFQVPGPILWVHAPEATLPPAVAANVETKAMPHGEQGFDLLSLLQELGRRQINDLWVEAGGRLAGSWLQSGWVDEYWLYLAPLMLGQSGLPLVATDFSHLAAAKRLQLQSTTQLGQDLRLILREVSCSQAS